MLRTPARARRHVDPGAAACPPAILGIDLELDKAAGRHRVAYVYENGPTDKDWVKVKGW
jgi:hypothetical protein